MNTPPVILVTGGARRVGAAIVRRLHEAGCRIALHYRGSADAAQALAGELNAIRADSVWPLAGDLADAGVPQQLVQATLAHFGRLDGLVNNASSFYATPLAEATAEQWDELFTVNARAPFFLAQAAAPALRDQRGAIVNLADIYAAHPRADCPIYCASKAALVSLTQSLAAALAPDVRVNAVAPGAIFWPETGRSDSERAAMLARTPFARTGSAEEVAETVAWLLCGAPYVTGQVIAVDGGRSITV